MREGLGGAGWYGVWERGSLGGTGGDAGAEGQRWDSSGLGRRQCMDTGMGSKFLQDEQCRGCR